MKNIFNKFISIFIALSLAGSSLPAGSFATAREQGPGISASMFPTYLGTVTQSWQGLPGRTIVLVQDLHCHPGVQRKTKEIIDYFNGRYTIGKIFVEGGSGKIDTSWISCIQDEKMRQGLIDKLLGSGRLSGAEYYGMTNGYPGNLYGLEERELHRSNLSRLKTIRENRGIRTVLDSMDEELCKAEDLYLHGRLGYFVDALRADEGREGRYYGRLARMARQLDIDLAWFPTLAAYAGKEKEARRTGVRSVEKELALLITELKEKMPYRDYCALLSATDDLRHPEELSARWGSLKKQYALGEKYPRLERYLHLCDNRGLSPEELTIDEQLLKREIVWRLAAGESERQVALLRDYFKSFRRYWEANITPYELKYVNDNKCDFMENWIRYTGGDSYVQLEPYRELLGSYYRVNEERTALFMEKIGVLPRSPGIEKETPGLPEQAPASSKEIDLVVMGGFHAGESAEKLRAAGVSHMVIMPKIEGDIAAAEANYRRIMDEQSINVALTSERPDDQIKIVACYVSEAMLEAGAADLQIKTVIEEGIRRLSEHPERPSNENEPFPSWRVSLTGNRHEMNIIIDGNAETMTCSQIDGKWQARIGGFGWEELARSPKPQTASFAYMLETVLRYAYDSIDVGTVAANWGGLLLGLFTEQKYALDEAEVKQQYRKTYDYMKREGQSVRNGIRITQIRGADNPELIYGDAWCLAQFYAKKRNAGVIEGTLYVHRALLETLENMQDDEEREAYIRALLDHEAWEYGALHPGESPDNTDAVRLREMHKGRKDLTPDDYHDLIRKGQSRLDRGQQAKLELLGKYIKTKWLYERLREEDIPFGRWHLPEGQDFDPSQIYALGGAFRGVFITGKDDSLNNEIEKIIRMLIDFDKGHIEFLYMFGVITKEQRDMLLKKFQGAEGIKELQTWLSRMNVPEKSKFRNRFRLLLLKYRQIPGWKEKELRPRLWPPYALDFYSWYRGIGSGAALTMLRRIIPENVWNAPRGTKPDNHQTASSIPERSVHASPPKDESFIEVTEPRHKASNEERTLFKKILKDLSKPRLSGPDKYEARIAYVETFLRQQGPDKPKLSRGYRAGRINLDMVEAITDRFMGAMDDVNAEDAENFAHNLLQFGYGTLAMMMARDIISRNFVEAVFISSDRDFVRDPFWIDDGQFRALHKQMRSFTLREYDPIKKSFRRGSSSEKFLQKRVERGLPGPSEEPELPPAAEPETPEIPVPAPVLREEVPVPSRASAEITSLNEVLDRIEREAGGDKAAMEEIIRDSGLSVEGRRGKPKAGGGEEEFRGKLAAEILKKDSSLSEKKAEKKASEFLRASLSQLARWVADGKLSREDALLISEKVYIFGDDDQNNEKAEAFAWIILAGEDPSRSATTTFGHNILQMLKLAFPDIKLGMDNIAVVWAVLTLSLFEEDHMDPGEAALRYGNVISGAEEMIRKQYGWEDTEVFIGRNRRLIHDGAWCLAMLDKTNGRKRLYIHEALARELNAMSESKRREVLRLLVGHEIREQRALDPLSPENVALLKFCGKTLATPDDYHLFAISDPRFAREEKMLRSAGEKAKDAWLASGSANASAGIGRPDILSERKQKKGTDKKEQAALLGKLRDMEGASFGEKLEVIRASGFKTGRRSAKSLRKTLIDRIYKVDSDHGTRISRAVTYISQLGIGGLAVLVALGSMDEDMALALVSGPRSLSLEQENALIARAKKIVASYANGAADPNNVGEQHGLTLDEVRLIADSFGLSGEMGMVFDALHRSRARFLETLRKRSLEHEKVKGGSEEASYGSFTGHFTGLYTRKKQEPGKARYSKYVLPAWEEIKESCSPLGIIVRFSHALSGKENRQLVTAVIESRDKETLRMTLDELVRLKADDRDVAVIMPGSPRGKYVCAIPCVLDDGSVAAVRVFKSVDPHRGIIILSIDTSLDDRMTAGDVQKDDAKKEKEELQKEKEELQKQLFRQACQELWHRIKYEPVLAHHLAGMNFPVNKYRTIELIAENSVIHDARVSRPHEKGWGGVKGAEPKVAVICDFDEIETKQSADLVRYFYGFKDYGIDTLVFRASSDGQIRAGNPGEKRLNQRMLRKLHRTGFKAFHEIPVKSERGKDLDDAKAAAGRKLSTGYDGLYFEASLRDDIPDGWFSDIQMLLQRHRIEQSPFIVINGEKQGLVRKAKRHGFIVVQYVAPGVLLPAGGQDDCLVLREDSGHAADADNMRRSIDQMFESRAGHIMMPSTLLLGRKMTEPMARSQYDLREKMKRLIRKRSDNALLRGCAGFTFRGKFGEGKALCPARYAAAETAGPAMTFDAVPGTEGDGMMVLASLFRRLQADQEGARRWLMSADSERGFSGLLNEALSGSPGFSEGKGRSLFDGLASAYSRETTPEGKAASIFSILDMAYGVCARRLEVRWQMKYQKQFHFDAASMETVDKLLFAIEDAGALAAGGALPEEARAFLLENNCGALCVALSNGIGLDRSLMPAFNGFSAEKKEKEYLLISGVAEVMYWSGQKNTATLPDVRSGIIVALEKMLRDPVTPGHKGQEALRDWAIAQIAAELDLLLDTPTNWECMRSIGEAVSDPLGVREVLKAS